MNRRSRWSRTRNSTTTALPAGNDRRLRRTGGLLTGLLTGLAACLLLALGPGRARADAAMPIYFVHGFAATPTQAYDCRFLTGYWGITLNYFKLGPPWNDLAWLAGDTNQHTVGYYLTDFNCDDYLGDNADGSDTRGTATTKTSIDTIAMKLANLIYHQSDYGTQPVSVVAHSMGGLVIRRAIDGINDQAPGYPARINVRNVITLSSPHGGYTGCTIGSGADFDRQCADMAPGSAFFTRQLGANGSNPQASQGTTWTIAGSTNDEKVSVDSAIAMPEVYERLVYHGPAAPNHNGWLIDDNGYPFADGPIPRLARQYHANDSQPFADGLVDHWMKLAAARALED